MIASNPWPASSDAGRVFTTENYPNSMMTQVIGINNGKTTDGFYVDNNNVTHGFVWTSAGGFQTIDDPSGIGTTVVNGINDKGVLVGFYGTAPINSGFVAFPH